jgi:hypothetical protein
VIISDSHLTGRPLDSIHNEFERGVCQAIYDSTEQRRRRAAIVAALSLKHGLRGLLFSWPLYLMGLAAFALPGQYSYLLSLLLLPGIYISVAILRGGLKEDYNRYVKNIILRPDALKTIIFKIHAP